MSLQPWLILHPEETDPRQIACGNLSLVAWQFAAWRDQGVPRDRIVIHYDQRLDDRGKTLILAALHNAYAAPISPSDLRDQTRQNCLASGYNPLD